MLSSLYKEIEILGADKSAALFAACKWTNEKVALGALGTLAVRSELGGKYMATRWGTWKIWLNLHLAKNPVEILQP